MLFRADDPVEFRQIDDVTVRWVYEDGSHLDMTVPASRDDLSLAGQVISLADGRQMIVSQSFDLDGAWSISGRQVLS